MWVNSKTFGTALVVLCLSGPLGILALRMAGEYGPNWFTLFISSTMGSMIVMFTAALARGIRNRPPRSPTFQHWARVRVQGGTGSWIAAVLGLDDGVLRIEREDGNQVLLPDASKVRAEEDEQFLVLTVGNQRFRVAFTVTPLSATSNVAAGQGLLSAPRLWLGWIDEARRRT